jgi:hypothetical protein
MRRSTLVALVVLIVIAAAAWLWTRETDRGADPERRDEPAASHPGERPGEPAAPPRALEAGGRAPRSDKPPTATEARGAGEAAAGVPTMGVHGRITTKAGAPAAGATVDVRVYRGRFVESAETTSDADGAYRVTVPRIPETDEVEGERTTITAVGRAAGFEKAEGYRVERSKVPEDVTLDVVLGDAMGQWVTGRVLLADGKPASNVDVHLCAVGHKFVTAAGRRAEGDGTFVLPVAQPGAALWVVAIDVTKGVARSDPFDVGAGEHRELPDLRLAPGGVVEGRVELPDGSPAPSVAVEAAPLGAAQGAGCAGDGLRMLFPQASTAPDGTFAFRHLNAGRYRVRLHGDKTTGDTDTAHDVETDARGLRFVLRERLLLVHVVDEAGKPFDGTSVGYEEVRPDGKDGAMGGGSFSGGFATIALPFARPCRVRVDVTAGALQADVLDVTLPEDRWRLETTVVLRPKSAVGTIRLELVDGDAKPVREFRAEAIPLLDGVPLRILGGGRWDSKGGPASSPPLRPGHYLLLVSPGQTNEVPASRGGPCSGCQRLEVDVAPGAETVAKVVARPGGWMRVTIVGKEGAEPFRCGCALVREGYEKERLLWSLWSDPDDLKRWRSLVSGGPQYYGLPLDPGRYVLTIGADGYVEARTTFDVRAGETTDVEVPLAPEPKPPK